MQKFCLYSPFCNKNVLMKVQRPKKKPGGPSEGPPGKERDADVRVSAPYEM